MQMDNGQPDETIVEISGEDIDMLRRGELPDKFAPTVSLPDNNPKSQYGTKKPSLLSCVPASALLIEGQVMSLGRFKYGPFNWRENSVSAEVYIDALLRHVMAWNAGQDNDEESGVSHLGHARACLGILIDAMENGAMIDDRPKDEATVRLINQFTRKD
jgi:hypothetical protein